MNRSAELPLGAAQGPDRAEQELGAPSPIGLAFHLAFLVWLTYNPCNSQADNVSL